MCTRTYALALNCAHAPSISKPHLLFSPRWTQIGNRDTTLYFGRLDEPEAEVRQLLRFASPVLEDSTHMSTFYFESVEAWRQAADTLDLVAHA